MKNIWNIFPNYRRVDVSGVEIVEYRGFWIRKFERFSMKISFLNKIYREYIYM